MPTEIRHLKVFLCHAHSDAVVVRGLYSRLKREGVDVWLDKEKLLPGSDWEVEIRRAVCEADVVVVCLSKQFAQKGFRQSEVRIALEEANLQPEGAIFIIPARLEECNVPQSLRRWHWVDLFEEDGYERLVRALRKRAENIGAVLQVQRSWLPRAAVAFQKGKEPAEGESLTASKKMKPDEMANQEKAKHESAEGTEGVNVESRFTRLAKSKERLVTPFHTLKLSIHKARFFLGIGVIIGVIVLGWLLGNSQIFSFVPIVQADVTPSAIATLTSTFPVSFTETIEPSITPTRTQTSTPTPRVITGDRFDEITLLDVITASENEQFTCADISPDGEIIAIGIYGATNSVQLRKTKGFALLKSLSTQDLYITNVLFSPDGNLLAAGAKDGTLRIWTVKTGKEIQEFKDTTVGIRKIGFSKDSRKLIASTASRIEVWDVATGIQLSAVNAATNQSFQLFAIDLNDRIGYAVREKYTRSIYPWDPVKKQYLSTTVPEEYMVYKTNYGKLEDIEQLPQFSNVNFQTVFDSSENGEMLLGGNWWQTSIFNFNNNEVKYFPHGGNRAIFSPDNRSIALTNYQDLSFIRISDGKVKIIPQAHKNEISSIVFSQDGWILISSSDDSVRIWGIPRWNSTPTPTTAPPTAVQ